MQFATSFPYYNICVVGTGVSSPFVTDLLNHDFKPYRCPRIKKMIEQVLLKEIAVLVEDWIILACDPKPCIILKMILSSICGIKRCTTRNQQRRKPNIWISRVGLSFLFF